MAHDHPIIDVDKHFTIDPTTRKVLPDKPDKANLVQFDHNSERLTFELPRYIDGHDMLTCNEVWVHFNNIEVSTKLTNSGVYQVTDLQVSEAAEDLLVCSWLVSQEATQLVGLLSFVVSFVCAAQDGSVGYRWNSAPYTGISVLNGIFNSDIVLEEYADILVEWEERLRALEEGGGGGGAPALSDALPLMDGEASSGTSGKAARGDHKHPVDGSRMPNIPLMDIGNTLAQGGVVAYSGANPKKLPWASLKTFLESNLECRANALFDPDMEYTASIPPLEEDTMLLTEQDIPSIVEQVIEALPAAEGASF